MISITFSYWWLLIAAIVVIAIVLAVKLGFGSDDDKYGVKTGFGCLIILFGLMMAAAIGGIFIW